jgi:bleomycin hydrolase
MFRTHNIEKKINKWAAKAKTVPKPKVNFIAAEAKGGGVVVVPILTVPTKLSINEKLVQNLEAKKLILENKLKEVSEEQVELETQIETRKTNETNGRDITFEQSMAVVKNTKEDATSFVLKNMPLHAVDIDPKKAANIMERHWDIDTGVKVPSNQLYSGRCWMFAGLNILVRQLINLKHFEPTFELSQSYLFFWHYIEQYNDVLSLFRYKPELHEPFNRERNDILEEPLHDGANWINFYRLVKKYGVVPKSMMPETIPSSSSSEMKETLSDMLAADLKEMEDQIPEWDTIDDEYNKREMFNTFRNDKMTRVVKLMCKYMGKPPLTGTIKLKTVTNMLPLTHPENKSNSSVEIESPLAFFNAINTISGKRFINGVDRVVNPIDVDDLVQIINDTRPAALSPNEKRVDENGVVISLPLSLDNTWYTTTYQEHKVHRNLLYNLKDMELISKMILVSLELDKPVWFACNMNTNVDKMRQGMDVDLFRPDLFTGFKLDMDRETRMKYGRAHCNHAMLIVGAETEVVTEVVTEGEIGGKSKTGTEGEAGSECKVVDRKVVAFNVENSWGSSGLHGGFYKMSIEWFKARVYTVVINRNVVSAVLASKPVQNIGFKEPTGKEVLGIYPVNDFFG